MYLNKPLLPTLDKSSKLMARTKMFVPDNAALAEDAAKDCNSKIKWHEAADDQTPQQIATVYGVDVEDVVRANSVKFKGLQSWSKVRLRRCEERFKNVSPYLARRCANVSPF